MESSGPWIPGPGLLLLLLLLPPLLSAGSFQHDVLNWRNFRHLDFGWKTIHRYLSPGWGSLHRSIRSKASKLHDCDGAFDFYLVLDASNGEGNTWNEICDLTERLLKRFTNPKLRISLITYSSVSNIILPLTSDRNELKQGLQRLRGVRPSGTRRLHDGLKRAGDEIAKIYSANNKAASMVYALTAGSLDKWTVWAAMRESNRLKNFKTKLYAIGMKNSQRNQLFEIVGAKTQVYELPKPDDMEGFIVSLVGNSCKQVMGGDTYYACVGESYHLGFYAPDLSPDKISDYTCRYKLDKNKVYRSSDKPRASPLHQDTSGPCLLTWVHRTGRALPFPHSHTTQGVNGLGG
ncbi:anthrax toxin receptor-like isoform X2 [Bos javanicus]|uniref:anthrax toxin receptor-like isoform X2 n=1 Tax=Bos javanicus TaxID=9906 RepID=UPI002AA7CAC5|nr:anthrax toxin receptor-like isoform X2 [Bos javanicus]